jgi:hypothetical protein
MATVEELLETLISVQESSAVEQSSADSSISSALQEINSGYQADTTTPNYIMSGLSLINASQGAYTSDEVIANNNSYYSDFVSIKELLTYQFIFFGAVIGFFLIWSVVKGFFKNVSS